MKKIEIAIIDYGMGNIHSVKKALESFGVKTKVTNQAQELKNCHKLILPGVGAFSDALRELKKRDLIFAILNHIQQKKFFLGICLGMQLLFTESEEAKGLKGLNVFLGKVKRLRLKKPLKVPHIGWNQLKIKNNHCPLLKGIPDNSYVYFCHSYYPLPQDPKVVSATTDYGIEFASFLWKDNIFAVQFHPEKSQHTGLKILKNFLEI